MKQKRSYFVQEEESGVFCVEVLAVVKYMRDLFCTSPSHLHSRTL